MILTLLESSIAELYRGMFFLSNMNLGHLSHWGEGSNCSKSGEIGSLDLRFVIKRLSIIWVYFDRIAASNSERASKKRDARGMALPGRSREGLLSRRLRRSAKG